MSRSHHLCTLAASAAVAVVALSACSGGSSGGASTRAGSAALDSAPRAAASAADAGGAKSNGAVNSTAGITSTAARIVPVTRSIVYKGSITVRVQDLTDAVNRAEALATGSGGLVAQEQTTEDPRHRGYGQASLTLRVPPADFGHTLDALGDLGRELDRSRSAEDVTTQVADVESRVRSAQASVARVRILLSRATTIGEVVRIESELSQRESDLESLQAQQKALAGLTDLATVAVTFVTPEHHVAPVYPVHHRELGFVAGLNGGWDAFAAAVTVALTGLGAVTPFVLVVTLLGFPAVMLLRRRRRAGASALAGGDTGP
ncbi:MAG TPA: DUF4349 domain-containing protein [Actinomycetes bacterium]|jgi:hypothetical protein|nr:DUF4349 domain-containing protein [Actinomycetes bacterium]